MERQTVQHNHLWEMRTHNRTLKLEACKLEEMGKNLFRSMSSKKVCLRAFTRSRAVAHPCNGKRTCERRKSRRAEASIQRLSSNRANHHWGNDKDRESALVLFLALRMITICNVTWDNQRALLRKWWRRTSARLRVIPHGIESPFQAGAHAGRRVVGELYRALKKIRR